MRKLTVNDILNLDADKVIKDSGSTTTAARILGAVMLRNGSAQALFDFTHLHSAEINKENNNLWIDPAVNQYWGRPDETTDIVDFLRKKNDEWRDSFKIHTIWLKKPDGIEVFTI